MPPTIQTGPTTDPLRILLHGRPGIGKTTFAAAAPGAIFIDAEGGGGDLDFSRIRVATWGAAIEALEWLLREKHNFQTVVLDTVDMLERFCWADLCRVGGVESIEDFNKGFGKGYTAAVERQQKMIALLDELRAKRGMGVIVLAHTTIKKFDDPEGLPYDRYQLAMNDKAAKLWIGWADAVLFAGLDVRVTETSKGKAKARDEKPARLIWTQERAQYDAKNRQGLPAELPLAWSAFAAAIKWADRSKFSTIPAKPAPDPVVAKPEVNGLPSLGMLQDAAKDAVLKHGWKRADVIELFAPATTAADVAPERRMGIILQLQKPSPNPNSDTQPGAK
jgi:hypothetical protein